MSYEKLGFVSGQKLKAEHLNHMEEGIANASAGASGSAIIDVLELPTENINEGVFYRLTTPYLVFNQYDQRESDRACFYVENLPEAGEPVTTDMSNLRVYYNAADGDVYGYITAEIGSQAGAPAGWYTLTQLAPLFDVVWSGVITDIEDDPCDDSFRLLLNKEFYIYQDEWCKLPFACEKAPKIDIKWDGNMDGRAALDMSMLGFAQGLYFVKVSDDVFTTDEVIGWRYSGQCYDDGGSFSSEIYQDMFDTSSYPGTFIINNYITVVYDEDALATALGIPTGIYTNGTYFWLYTEEGYVSNLTSPVRITKIESKYLDVDLDIDASSLGLHSVATSGNYNDLYNKPNLNNYVTTSQVQTMISNAIGSAIGGGY